MRLSVWSPLALASIVGCGGGAESTPAAPDKEVARAPAERAAEPAAPAPVVEEPEAEPAPVLPKTPASLDAAVETARQLYAEHRQTMLCGCKFSNNDRVNAGSCRYRARGDEALAKWVAWSHLVPPSDFGAERACWTQPLCKDDEGKAYGGVECCQASDPQFAAMRTDLHNIVPIIGEVASDRSNYAFGELEGEHRMYGACDLEIDREGEVIEPMPSVRGDVARTYLYFAETYPGALVLSAQQKLTFRAWAAEDPPSEWEIERARAITAIQGIEPGWLAAVDATEQADTGEVVQAVPPPVETAPLPTGQAAG